MPQGAATFPKRMGATTRSPHARHRMSGMVLRVMAVGLTWLAASTSHAVEMVSVKMPSDSQAGVYAVDATMVLNAPPVAVRFVLARLCQYRGRIDYLVECRVFRREGDTTWSYALAAPPIVQPRDWVIATTVEENLKPDGTGVYRSRWHLDERYGPSQRGGVTRLSVNEGTWTLTPLDGGLRTQARYRIRCAPGGVIPASAVGYVVAHTLPDSMRALEQVAREEWQQGRVAMPQEDPWDGLKVESLERLAKPSPASRLMIPASMLP